MNNHHYDQSRFVFIIIGISALLKEKSDEERNYESGEIYTPKYVPHSSLGRKLLRNLDILQSYIPENLTEIDLSKSFLTLGENFIDNLNNLRLYRFQRLQMLSLSMNLIVNIEPLGHCDFPSL